MPKTKTMSVRLEPGLHEQIIDECNIRGCKPNEFLTEAINHELEEIAPESEEIENESEEPKILSNLGVNLGKVYDEDGNLVGTIRKNS